MPMIVIVYSKPNCQQCKMTCKKLDDLGIEYRKLDITEDTAAFEACKLLGYQSAPVVVAGDDHWSGFRPDRLAALAA